MNQIPLLQNVGLMNQAPTRDESSPCAR